MVAAVLLLVLVVASVLVAREIGGASGVQDCVMQGRTNCAPVR